MFKGSFKGFDKDEVLSYIQKQEEDYNKQLSELEKEVKNRDKIIQELKGRIAQKDEQRALLEDEIETKYKKYIDNYDKIGALVYESQIKGDKMIADAKVQADKIIAAANAEAKTKVDSVQSEVDAKLADGKQKYLAVQDVMNEVVELINQMQRKFMTSYKEMHEIVQNMPGSLNDMGEAEDSGNEADDDTAGIFETGELNFDTSTLPLDMDDEETEDQNASDRASLRAASRPVQELRDTGSKKGTEQT
jgi:cell division septum initiation protein DivIVA